MVRSGDKIVELREKYGMTQEELASKIGISRASLSHYEKNRRTPDYTILTHIADYFRVTVDYLLGRSEEVPDENPLLLGEDLELTDLQLLNTFSFTVDGRRLTLEESHQLIAFIRAERAMKP